MARLIDSAIASLDGYVEDVDGDFWMGDAGRGGPRLRQTASSARTRIERHIDPKAIRGTKASAARDLSVGGPGLAAAALGAALVDECGLFVVPIVVGGARGSSPSASACRSTCSTGGGSATGWVYVRNLVAS